MSLLKINNIQALVNFCMVLTQQFECTCRIPVTTTLLADTLHVCTVRLCDTKIRGKYEHEKSRLWPSCFSLMLPYMSLDFTGSIRTLGEN